MAKLFVEDLSLSGKRVLVRVDFNVPIKDGAVESDKRLRESLPTLRYCLEQGASLVLMSHLGRPDGKRNEAIAAVPDALVDALHLVGPPERIRDRFQVWKQSRVGTLIIGALQPEAVRLMAELNAA